MTGVARPATHIERFAHVNGLRMRYLDAPGGAPPMVLLHGLSANASAFAGLMDAGLSPAFRVIAPDLRGRGGTDKPESGYTMSHHAADVIALLDHLDLERVVLVGHSFGGFLAIHMAANHPERVSQLAVIDAAITLSPHVVDMLRPSLARLGRVFPSADAYLAEMRLAAAVGSAWDRHLEGFYRAEMAENADGTVQSSTSGTAVGQALSDTRGIPWREVVAQVRTPALVLNAVGAYGPPGAPPLITEEQARETADLFPNGRYVQVPGNHLTMVFGDGARAVAREITSFVRSSQAGSQ